ncbi:hypothetical protein ACQ4PT_010681 [Festuca glaucescens]
MERSSSSSLVCAVAILAILCCSLSCSAAARVGLDGSRDPRAPPSPVSGRPVDTPTPAVFPPPPPLVPEMSARTPHRKTLQQQQQAYA